MEHFLFAVSNSVAVTALASIASLGISIIAITWGLLRRKLQDRGATHDEVINDVHEVLREIQNVEAVPKSLRDRARNVDQAMMSR